MEVRKSGRLCLIINVVLPINFRTVTRSMNRIDADVEIHANEIFSN